MAKKHTPPLANGSFQNTNETASKTELGWNAFQEFLASKGLKKIFHASIKTNEYPNGEVLTGKW